jgi:hypothetical protein
MMYVYEIWNFRSEDREEWAIILKKAMVKL